MMYLCSAVQVRSTPQSGSVAARSEVSMQNVFFFFAEYQYSVLYGLYSIVAIGSYYVWFLDRSGAF